jgi:hypothetical protein
MTLLRHWLDFIQPFLIGAAAGWLLSGLERRSRRR